MKRFFALCLCIVLSLPAGAVDDAIVKYVGGTAHGLKTDAVGKIDTSSETGLIFDSSANKLTISYASIESFQISSEVNRHLGVLPAIAVGLLKARQRRHLLRISYRDQPRTPNGGQRSDQTRDLGGIPQVVIFEVPKHLVRTLQSVLDARAPHRSQSRARCRVLN